MTITKSEYAEYKRLKAAEREGHLLTQETLRLIIRACEGDPAKIGRHFLEVYYRWKRGNTFWHEAE